MNHVEGVTPAERAAITELIATARSTAADRAANIAAASQPGETAAHVLEQHGWPQLD